jgi:hypothetical protein
MPVGLSYAFDTVLKRTAGMKSIARVFLVVVALVIGGYASQAYFSDTAPMASDYRDDCVVDDQSNCTQRCLTEHDCCVKSCNWVRERDRSECLKRCKSVLRKCYQDCDEEAALDQPSTSASEPEGGSATGE